MIYKELFSEKFRPQNLSQLIAPKRVKEELDKGLIQNLLLYSQPGMGKTSALFILAKPHTSIYINASLDRGIDVIRDRISKFCSTISLEEGKEKLKCVILDEIDGGTPEFFSGFKASIERYSSMARFIASCNYIQKIPDPIRSRFNCISFDPINTEEEIYLFGEYKKRIGSILNAAKISFTPEILDKFTKGNFPDMRALMNKAQSFFLRGIKELNSENFNVNFDFKDLFDLCLSKPDKPYDNYKLIINLYGVKVDDSLSALGNDFPEYLKNKAPNKLDKLPLVLITVAEYQYQRNFVIDPIISVLACCLKIQQILNT